MAQVRRILNQEELVGFVSFIALRSRLDPLPEQIKTPLKEWFSGKNLLRWIQSDDRNQDYFFEVKRPPIGTWNKDPSQRPRRLFYIDPVEGEVRLYPDTDWDLQDADKGTLCYFKPEHIRQQRALVTDLQDIADYLLSWYPQNEKEDLRKITAPQCLAKHNAWKEAELRRIEREQAERRERERIAAEAAHQLRIEEQLNRVRQGGRADRNIYDHRADNGVSVEDGSHLVAGLDYHEIDRTDSYLFVMLNTQAALDWEAFKLKHCVFGYLADIKSGSSVILSMRHVDKPLAGLVTIELVPNKGMRWEDKDASGFTINQAYSIGNSDPMPEHMAVIDSRKPEWNMEKLTPALHFKVDKNGV